MVYGTGGTLLVVRKSTTISLVLLALSCRWLLSLAPLHKVSHHPYMLLCVVTGVLADDHSIIRELLQVTGLKSRSGSGKCRQ